MQRASTGPVERSTTFSILRKGDTRPRKGSAPGRSSGSRLSGYVSSFPGDPSGFVDTPTAYSCGYSPGIAQNERTGFPLRPPPFGFDDQAPSLNKMKFAASIEFTWALCRHSIQKPRNSSWVRTLVHLQKHHNFGGFWSKLEFNCSHKIQCQQRTVRGHPFKTQHREDWVHHRPTPHEGPTSASEWRTAGPFAKVSQMSIRSAMLRASSSSTPR